MIGPEPKPKKLPPPLERELELDPPDSAKSNKSSSSQPLSIETHTRPAMNTRIALSPKKGFSGIGEESEVQGLKTFE